MLVYISGTQLRTGPRESKLNLSTREWMLLFSDLLEYYQYREYISLYHNVFSSLSAVSEFSYILIESDEAHVKPTILQDGGHEPLRSPREARYHHAPRPAPGPAAPSGFDGDKLGTTAAGC